MRHDTARNVATRHIRKEQNKTQQNITKQNSAEHSTTPHYNTTHHNIAQQNTTQHNTHRAAWRGEAVMPFCLRRNIVANRVQNKITVTNPLLYSKDQLRYSIITEILRPRSTYCGHRARSYTKNTFHGHRTSAIARSQRAKIIPHTTKSCSKDTPKSDPETT